MFNLLAELLSLVLGQLKAINTRLAALEAGEVAEASDEAASAQQMQALLDSVKETAALPTGLM